MENYRNQLLKFLKIRETRSLWRYLKKMRPDEVVEELQNQECSILGSIKILYERLFRLRLELCLPNPDLVPWWDSYDLAGSQKLLLIEAFAKPGDNGAENSKTSRRGKKPKKSSELSSDSRSGEEDLAQ